MNLYPCDLFSLVREGPSIVHLYVGKVAHTLGYVIENVPIATGEVVEVLTGICVLIHSSLYLDGQVKTFITLTRIRGGRDGAVFINSVKNTQYYAQS